MAGCCATVTASSPSVGSGTPPAMARCACMHQSRRKMALTIRGLLRGDLMPSKVMEEIPLGHLIVGNIGGSEYPVAEPDDPRNQLTVRNAPEAVRAVIPTVGVAIRAHG